ncbi:putative adhesin [Umezawaea sp. Da 62-37]|uniref:putative adhesin n=1 Tax=Umezawaea sp. Da 62-37 TaxID=3075927 RepID=UPI0028F714F1|nr:hypothetical protein [Umezawaea sp. Da 62-37]WNV87926.1 hypothetical protein RM788_06470 [Umezawaea sp. Da 62-37]
MPGVIATGHSAWHPSAAEPFVTVPEGMRVLFFQEPLHLLADTVGRRLEQLDDTAFRDPTGVAEAGSRCRDYSLTHPSMLDFARVPADHPEYRQVIPEQGRTVRLSEILHDPANAGRTVYWGACLAVDLEHRGGVHVGVNTGWSGTSAPGDGTKTGAYLSPGDLDAAVRDDPLRQRLVAAGGDVESVEPGLYVDKLTARAIPDGASAQDLASVVAVLANAKESPDWLAAAFVGLDHADRRGLLLNDTTRWWLADLGLHVPESVSDGAVEVDDPRYWIADDHSLDVDAVVRRNHEVLKALEAQDFEPVVHCDGLVVVGTGHHPMTTKWVTGREIESAGSVTAVVVDRHVQWVVHGCPASLRGTVHEALVEAGAEDVWFDAPPTAVFDGDVFESAVRGNTTALLHLGERLHVLVDHRYTLFTDGDSHPEHLVEEVTASAHCVGTLERGDPAQPEDYVVTGVGEACGCAWKVATMVELAAGPGALLRFD